MDTASTEISTIENSRMQKCPQCDDAMERIRRTFLMRALTGSKRYYCRHCRSKYLCFRGYILPF